VHYRSSDKKDKLIKSRKNYARDILLLNGGTNYPTMQCFRKEMYDFVQLQVTQRQFQQTMSTYVV